jgi:hypothetical protein
VYNVIYLDTILKLGIIVHMTPEEERKVVSSLRSRNMSITTPFVPPPGSWRDFDVSNFGNDDNFLLECVDYCASKYQQFGGNVSPQEYKRAALTALRSNPSLLPPVQWVDQQLAQLPTANPARPSRSTSTAAAERKLSAFLNDPTWATYGGVENPRQ